jgi:hypothetical protein
MACRSSVPARVPPVAARFVPGFGDGLYVAPAARTPRCALAANRRRMAEVPTTTKSSQRQTEDGVDAKTMAYQTLLLGEAGLLIVTSDHVGFETEERGIRTTGSPSTGYRVACLAGKPCRPHVCCRCASPVAKLTEMCRLIVDYSNLQQAVSLLFACGSTTSAVPGQDSHA